MRAVVQDRFGPPEMLELREVERPEAGDSQVLVRVRAASVNPADWYAMTGMPWLARPAMGLRRPRTGRLGVDLAGEVEAVGRNVTRFRPGDAVFGTGDGTLAEYVAVGEATLAGKPGRLERQPGLGGRDVLGQGAVAGPEHRVARPEAGDVPPHGRLPATSSSRSWRRPLPVKSSLV